MRNLLPILTIPLLAAALVAAPAGTSTLSVTVGTDTVDVSVTGSLPEASTWLVSSEDTGSSTVRLGNFTTVTFDLASPLYPIPLGETDANGDLNVTLSVPDAGTYGLTLHAQALSVEVTMPPPALTTMLSNVDSFSL